MPVLAYLDPGSGSLVLQAVLGGAAGIGVAARAMKQRWERRRVTGDKAADDQRVDPTRTGTASGAAGN